MGEERNQATHWPLPLCTQRSNKHGHENEVQGGTHSSAEQSRADAAKIDMERQLTSWNALDIELYNKVAELFAEQVEIARSSSGRLAALLDNARDGIFPECTSFSEWRRP